MSDDIVADLRSYTERFELSPRIQGKLMLEAADEIERLRAALNDIFKYYDREFRRGDKAYQAAIIARRVLHP